jgi:eight-cysteine-cluster-containing protein
LSGWASGAARGGPVAASNLLCVYRTRSELLQDPPSMEIIPMLFRTILAAAITLVLVGLSPATAEACSCMPSDVATSYQNAEVVVAATIKRQLKKAPAGTIRFRAKNRYTFKDCEGVGRKIIVQTASSSAACGMNLKKGETYLLNGQVVGWKKGKLIISVNLCDYNRPVSELTSKDIDYLLSQDPQGSCTACEYDGQNYQAGDSFPSTDMCNACTCLESGDVACTKVACADPDPNPCVPAGCSGQLCVHEKSKDIITTCEWLPEYSCLPYQSCGPYGAKGSCTWMTTPASNVCIDNLN